MDVMGSALARALAPAIRILTVSPGVVATDFVPGRDQAWNDKAAAATPLKRVASAEDIARAVLACATHLTFSTGSVIQVDGGRLEHALRNLVGNAIAHGAEPNHHDGDVERDRLVDNLIDVVERYGDKNGVGPFNRKVGNLVF